MQQVHHHHRGGWRAALWEYIGCGVFVVGMPIAWSSMGMPSGKVFFISWAATTILAVLIVGIPGWVRQFTEVKIEAEGRTPVLTVANPFGAKRYQVDEDDVIVVRIFASGSQVPSSYLELSKREERRKYKIGIEFAREQLVAMKRRIEEIRSTKTWEASLH